MKGGGKKKTLLIGDLRRKRLKSRLGTKTSTRHNAAKVTVLFIYKIDQLLALFIIFLIYIIYNISHIIFFKNIQFFD